MSTQRIATLKRMLGDVARRWDMAHECWKQAKRTTMTAEDYARRANSIAREIQALDPSFIWTPLPEGTKRDGKAMDEFLGAVADSSTKED